MARHPNSKITFLKEGLRIFGRNIKAKIFGIERFIGNDEDICTRIIISCFDTEKKYFMASSQNYHAFYSRDFGWCIESLIRLGFKKESLSTLEYALGCYEKCGEIRVAISREGIAYNFPDIYSPDSVAYLFRSIRVLGSKNLILQHRNFLNSEIRRFEEKVIDKKKGIVKDEIFSGMRDYVKTKGSCYDMIMACMLSDEIKKINIKFGKILDERLGKLGLKENLKKHFWNGKYFKESLDSDVCCGHANVYPYFLDVITDKKMLDSSIRSIRKNRLDEPFPLKYGYGKDTKFIAYEVFAKDWEKDTIWAMLGMAYINTLFKTNKKLATACLRSYEKNIKKNQGFTEVYDNKGNYYKSLFFTSDNSMLWASMYLDMKLRLLH